MAISSDKTAEPSPQRPDKDTHADLLTGAPGSHPVGTALGAAGAGVAGAALGASTGPSGAVIGASLGALTGGMIGKGIAESIDPTSEEAYWRDNYAATRLPQIDEFGFADYGPAFRAGYEGFKVYAPQGRTFEQVEEDLKREWSERKGESRLSWENAAIAARAAWRRLEEQFGY